MELSDPYTIGWILWMLGFVGLEGKALWNEQSGDTLSEHIWAWFSIKHDGPMKIARRSALGVGVGWAAGHFFGLW